MQQQIDIEDAVVSPFFVLSSAIAVGLISFSLFGFDFGSTAYELTAAGYTTTIKWATLGSIIALGIAYATNKPTLSSMGLIETWAVVATIALVMAPPFVPLLSALLSSKIAGLVAVIIQAAGFYSLSYLG